MYPPSWRPDLHAYSFPQLTDDTVLREFDASLSHARTTTAIMLSPHLSPHTADELLAAATHKRNAEIERLLAARFPKPDVPTDLRPLGPAGVTGEPAPAVNALALQVAPELLVPSDAPNVAVQTEPLTPRARLASLSPGRFAVQFTIDQATHDKLRLRCRVHDQFEAECTFSAEVMRGKQEAARELAAERKAAKADAEALAKAKAEAQARADAKSKAREEFAREQDVIPWLRQLKFSLAAARKGAQACAHIPDAPLEQRVKVAPWAPAPHCPRIPAPSAGSLNDGDGPAAAPLA